MNFFKLVLTFLFISFLSASYSSEAEEAIKKRILPVGQVCIEGQDCAENTAAQSTNLATNRTGKAIYESACATCHGIGLAGAPKFGDRFCWGERADEDLDHLVETVTTGLNGMPPMGLCMDCSSEELTEAVQYMLDSLK